MSAMTDFNISMDVNLIKECEDIYRSLGLDFATAINVFAHKTLDAGGFPFDVRIGEPNKRTIAAMLEAERLENDPSVKRYTDLDELFSDLEA